MLQEQMTMIRPHQETAINMLRESVREGNKNTVLAAPCSFGKTRVAVEILKSVAQNGKRGIFICDRIKLVQQALLEFDQAGIEVGVMQGSHWRTNPSAPVQIASVQTLAKRKYQPLFNVAIVDECHTQYQYLEKLMGMSRNAIFIGLSATPYSKGLGLHYSNLVLPITPQELLDKHYLCPVTYYGGHQTDLTGVKNKRLPTGGKDFDPKSLSEAVERDEKLVGHIIENFKAHGKGQTIAFCPSIKSSKALVQMFVAAGFQAEHIDGYMSEEERNVLYEAHDRGEFQILSCSRLLNTGYDAPRVVTLIDCFPTKSLIAYVQRAGRVMRIHPNKVSAVYLDHAGNVSRHGFPEQIIPESLSMEEAEYSERELTKDKKESELSVCPECFQHFLARCACGYERPVREKIVSDDQMLKELKKTNRDTSREDKQRWLGEFQLYGKAKGYKAGWASWAYRSKFGVWPNAIKAIPCKEVSGDVGGYVKHLHIRKVKSVA
jgi:DNA repair protein RadD